MENKLYTVTKLTGDNFFIWKMRLEMILQKEKLWNVVEEEAPEEPSLEWRQRDQSARATIGLALDDKILVTISGCNTAKSAWDKLKKTYEYSNMTSKIYLLKKLYGSKYESFTNMENYISGINEIIERLRCIGKIIKDDDIIAILLCGLPNTYDGLITSIETKREEDLELEFVCNKLRDEAARKETNAENYHETAMSSNDRIASHYRKSRIICHACNQEGHIRRNCKNTKTNNTIVNDERHTGLTTYEKDKEECINLLEEWALSGSTIDTENKPESWVLDSGASIHMTNTKSDFRNYRTLEEPVTVKLANGEMVKAVGKGNVELWISGENQVPDKIILSNTLFVPNLKVKLISVIALCRDKYTIVFDKASFKILLHNDIINCTHVDNNIYNLKGKVKTVEVANATCVHQWHERMGHKCISSILTMAKQQNVNNLKIDPCSHSDYCETCQISKMASRPFKTSCNNASKPFKTVVTDVCGPFSPTTYGGNKYIITVTDQYSGYTQIELMKYKNEATDIVARILKRGRNHFGYYPEILRSDGGGEYCNTAFDKFLDEHGIIHQLIVPNTPQQNGQSERMNRSLLCTIRSLLKGKEMPIELWGEAAYSAAYLHNRFLSSGRNKTPYELWWGKTPQVGHLKVFGSIAYAHIPKCNRTKLDDTSIKGRLVGYGINRKSYRIWIEGTRKVINATTVSFCEYKPNTSVIEKDSNVTVTLIDSQEPLDWPTEKTESKCEEDTKSPLLRRSDRSTKGIGAVRLSY